MFTVIQRYVFAMVGGLFLATHVSAQSFDQTVEAYGGAPAFDIILVQDCSVLDNTADANLDQEYNAKLCSAEDESALADVRDLLRSKALIPFKWRFQLPALRFDQTHEKALLISATFTVMLISPTRSNRLTSRPCGGSHGGLTSMLRLTS